jgi:pseudouridine 5'-phosphatase
VFLTAAREALGRPVGEDEACTDLELIERRKGLVFEDAIPGMQAGKRAGMSGTVYLGPVMQGLADALLCTVIWVPDANLLDVEYHGTEKPDQTLKSIEDFVPEQWGLPPYA